MVSTIYFMKDLQRQKKAFITYNNEYRSICKSSFTLFLLRNVTLSLIKERPGACVLYLQTHSS